MYMIGWMIKQQQQQRAVRNKTSGMLARTAFPFWFFYRKKLIQIIFLLCGACAKYFFQKILILAFQVKIVCKCGYSDIYCCPMVLALWLSCFCFLILFNLNYETLKNPASETSFGTRGFFNLPCIFNVISICIFSLFFLIFCFYFYREEW